MPETLTVAPAQFPDSLARASGLSGRSRTGASGLDEPDAASEVCLYPEGDLSCEQVEAVACHPEQPVVLSAAAAAAVARGQAWFEQVRQDGQAIYGTTTGFGPFVTYAVADQGGHEHGLGLIHHLGAGVGPTAPVTWVRAAMFVRAAVLARGHSGVALATVEGYLALLNRGLTPVMPQLGSVGASGDLIPLSYAARALAGEGEVWDGSRRQPAAAALAAAGLTPGRLTGRDALALTNGTSYLTAVAALAVARGRRLLALAEGLTGWLYRTLGCPLQALDPVLHRLRGHPGQVESAARIRQEALRGASREADRSVPERPLQEIYSIRCAPQVLGACRDQLTYAGGVVEAELSGVNDNPVFFERGGHGAVAHGGNFHGQQVAFAADALNAALTQTALLADRQVDALANPAVNGRAPLLLAWNPGQCSGLAGAQICATALAAEMRTACQAHAVATIPTNGGNQDIVPMGALAARRAFHQTELLARVLAVLAIALAQLNDLKARGRAPGPPAAAPPWFPGFEPFQADRPLDDDIERLASRWLATGLVISH